MDLKNAIVRLAHQEPTTRKHLVPMLRQGGVTWTSSIWSGGKMFEVPWEGDSRVLLRVYYTEERWGVRAYFQNRDLRANGLPYERLPSAVQAPTVKISPRKTKFIPRPVETARAVKDYVLQEFARSKHNIEAPLKGALEDRLVEEGRSTLAALDKLIGNIKKLSLLSQADQIPAQVERAETLLQDLRAVGAEKQYEKAKAQWDAFLSNLHKRSESLEDSLEKDILEAHEVLVEDSASHRDDTYEDYKNRGSDNTWTNLRKVLDEKLEQLRQLDADRAKRLDRKIQEDRNN